GRYRSRSQSAPVRVAIQPPSASRSLAAPRSAARKAARRSSVTASHGSPPSTRRSARSRALAGSGARGGAKVEGGGLSAKTIGEEEGTGVAARIIQSFPETGSSRYLRP